MMRIATIGTIICGLGILSISSGCGKSPYQMVKVKGTVKCNGQLLKNGFVTFRPKPASETVTAPGKSASGAVAEDGTYYMTTYADGDGAVVGVHEVTVTVVPSKDELDASGDDNPDPWAHQKPACGSGTMEIKVEAGKETYPIELTDKKPAG